MKKAILLILASLLFLFTGCEALGLTEETDKPLVLTAAEVENTAMVSIMTGFVSMEGYGASLQGVSETDMEAEMDGLDVTINADGSVTFSFTNATMTETDEDTNTEFAIVTLNGSFTGSGNQDTGITITYDDFNLINPEDATESFTVNGTMTMVAADDTTATITCSLVISDVVSADIEVVVVLSMPMDGGDPTLVSATIEGEDYLTEFNEAVSSMNM